MSDDDIRSRSIRFPEWGGKRSNYSMWLARFSAYAQVKNFVAEIDIKKEADMPASGIEFIADDDAGKLKRPLKKSEQESFCQSDNCVYLAGIVKQDTCNHEYRMARRVGM